MISRWQRRAIHRRQEEREREQFAQDMSRAANEVSDLLGVCPASPTGEHLDGPDGITCDLCGGRRRR